MNLNSENTVLLPFIEKILPKEGLIQKLIIKLKKKIH